MKDEIINEILERLRQQLEGNCDIKVQEIQKNNGTKQTGILIRQGDSNVAATLYIDQGVDAIASGQSTAEEVAKEIAKAYENSHTEEVKKIVERMDFKDAKERLRCAAINYDLNKNMLKDSPHKRVEDLAIVARYKVSDNASFIVKNDMLERLGMSKNEAVEYAIKNSIKEGYTVKPMYEVINNLVGPIDNEMMGVMPPDPGMYIITNNTTNGGAGIYVDRNLRAEVRETIGGDYYILPSSIFETIAISKDMAQDYRMLETMVAEVNATQVAPTEVLSGSVYLVDQTLQIKQCGAERETVKESAVEQTSKQSMVI